MCIWKTNQACKCLEDVVYFCVNCKLLHTIISRLILLTNKCMGCSCSEPFHQYRASNIESCKGGKTPITVFNLHEGINKAYKRNLFRTVYRTLVFWGLNVCLSDLLFLCIWFKMCFSTLSVISFESSLKTATSEEAQAGGGKIET